MGEYSRTSLISILFLFLLIFISISSAKPGIRKHYKPCKTLVLFFHDIMYNGHNAANATSIIAAAPEGGKRTLPADNFNFGYVIVFDDPVTLDSNLHSPPIGRAQGMYTYDSKVFFTSGFGFSFVLNSTDYKGTINCFGADPAAIPSRDISVMGGTEDFFMHRGIATLTTDAIEGVAYFRLRVDIKFYECW